VLLRLFFKLFFVWKYIEIIYIFIFKNLFLILAYQNDMKHLKKINLKQEKSKFDEKPIRP
jgi:predicted membrane protein